MLLAPACKPTTISAAGWATHMVVTRSPVQSRPVHGTVEQGSELLVPDGALGVWPAVTPGTPAAARAAVTSAAPGAEGVLVPLVPQPLT